MLRPNETPDIIGMATKAQNLRSLAMQNQAEEQKRAMQAQDAKEQMTMNELLKKHSSVDPTSGKLNINQGLAMSEMMGKVSPQRVMEFQKQIGQFNDSQLSNMLDVSEKGYRLALSNPNAWPEVRKSLIDNGVPNANSLPEQYDQGIITRGLIGTQKYKEQHDQKMAEQSASLAQQKADQGEALDRDKLAYQKYKDAKDFSLKERELGQKMSESKKSGNNLELDQKKLVEGLSTKNANKIAIKNQIDAVMGSWDSLSDDQKVASGRSLLKTLNSTEGADAIGTEEAKRLGSKLEFAMGNLSPFNSNPIQFGRDLKGFKEQAINASKSIGNAVKTNQSIIDKTMGRETSTPSIKVGTEDSGFIFMGGDPANKNNWKRAR